MSQFTSRAVGELKSQGAAEAAQDPDSKVSAQDAERTMVNETLKAGGAAYQFDPNASPEEKAAQAQSVCRRFYVSGGQTNKTHDIASMYLRTFTTIKNLTPPQLPQILFVKPLRAGLTQDL